LFYPRSERGCQAVGSRLGLGDCPARGAQCGRDVIWSRRSLQRSAQWHPHYVGGHERAPQRICIRDIVVMPTTSSFA